MDRHQGHTTQASRQWLGLSISEEYDMNIFRYIAIASMLLLTQQANAAAPCSTATLTGQYSGQTTIQQPENLNLHGDKFSRYGVFQLRISADGAGALHADMYNSLNAEDWASSHETTYNVSDDCVVRFFLTVTTKDKDEPIVIDYRLVLRNINGRTHVAQNAQGRIAIGAWEYSAPLGIGRIQNAGASQ
jgi:hypothetical protein